MPRLLLVLCLLACTLWPRALHAAIPDSSDNFDYDPDLDPSPDAPPIDLQPRLKVAKKAPKRRQKGLFVMGAGYDMSQGVLLIAGVSGRNLFGIDGLHIDLETQWSAMQFKGEFSLGYDPSWSPFFGKIQLGAGRSRFGLLEDGEQDLLLQSIGGFAEAGIKWGGGWRASLRYRLFHTTLDNGHLLGDSMALPSDAWARPRLQSALQLRLSYDSPISLDPISQMRVGVQFVASLEGSHAALGSDFQYLRGELHARFGTMLPGGLHLSAGFDAGLLVGNSAQIPFSMRYRLGGIGGISASLPDVGPLIGTGAGRLSIGGQGMVRAYTELRVPLWKQAGLYAFGAMEAGAIVHSAAAVAGAPADLALQASWSAAAIVGLLWRSPIGPLRLGISIPFVTQHPGDPPILFQFSIGNSF